MDAECKLALADISENEILIELQQPHLDVVERLAIRVGEHRIAVARRPDRWSRKRNWHGNLVVKSINLPKYLFDGVPI